MTKICLFIPCYNCENQIPRVIKQLSNNDNYKQFNEILIIDNGSNDSTIDNATRSIKELNILNAQVFKNNINMGLGGTHKVAFKYAKENSSDYVAVLHGDDQGNIDDLIQIIKNNTYLDYECCLGSRFSIKSNLVGYSKFRILGNLVFNTIFTICSGSIVKDLGAGLNIYKVSSLDLKTINEFSNDLTFNCYLLLYSVYKKHKKIYFPLTWKEDDQISNVKLVSQAKRTLAIAAKYFVHRIDSLSIKNGSKKIREHQFEILFKGINND
jgi:glycosyltransferase involved in cell wall biosynthesis